jgi:hypothetical protein
VDHRGSPRPHGPVVVHCQQAQRCYSRATVLPAAPDATVMVVPGMDPFRRRPFLVDPQPPRALRGHAARLASLHDAGRLEAARLKHLAAGALSQPRAPAVCGFHGGCGMAAFGLGRRDFPAKKEPGQWADRGERRGVGSHYQAWPEPALRMRHIAVMCRGNAT